MKCILFLMLIAPILWSCTNKDSQQKKAPIVIGEFGSLTGSESSFGENTHKGIALAIEQQNKRGGVRGHKIKLITLDNQSRLEKTREVVKELIEEHKVLALLGEVASQRTLAAAPIAQAEKVPLLTPSSTNPKVTEVGNYIFRACYTDPFQGKVMANFASDKLKVKKVAVITDKSSDYSKGLAEHFIDTFQKLGGKVVASEQYQAGDIDFKDQLRHFRAKDPEAIFIPGYYTEAALIARQVRRLGIKAHLLGGDGWDSPRLFEIGRDAVNGAFFSNHYTNESRRPESLEFVKAFKKRYKEKPDGVAAMGYDAARILIQAIEKSPNLDRQSIRKAIAHTKKFKGVTGEISINDQRNGVKPSVVLKVDGPSHRFVTTIEP